MRTEAAWWYERNGSQAGPVDGAALVELIRAGEVGAAARVWRSGMAEWEPIASVPQLASALPARIPGLEPTPPPFPTGVPRPTLPPGMEPVPTGAVIGFGILTLGIYPMVKFYQAGTAYEALAGRRSHFMLYFWLSIGLALAGGPLHALFSVPGVMAHVAAVVLAMLTLFEVLAVRADLVRRCSISPALTSDTTHKALFIIGLLTTWMLVGVVLLVVEAVKFFTDHAAIGDALRRGAAAPFGTAGLSAGPLAR